MLSRCSPKRIVPLSLRLQCQRQPKRAWLSNKTAEPLRILFCGSDEFSSGSLRALFDYQKNSPKKIKSIDVLCRPAKPTGRSLKVIREVPIKAVAEELGLRVHQRDTFTGWDLPLPDGEPINLIIAVSFGLFVPPRILKSAQYGGLNLHPSLLPNFRGAAPLQWAIMEGCETTGVTLQTLDDKTFDHGKILLQTEPLHLETMGLRRPTFVSLRDFLTQHAQRLLIQGIREHLFVSTLRESAVVSPSSNLVIARKIKSDDAQVNWSKSSAEIARTYRALGSVWTKLRHKNGSTVRVKLDDVEEVTHEEHLSIEGKLIASHAAGEKSLTCSAMKDGSVVFIGSCLNHHSLTGEYVDLRVGYITVEGKSKVTARAALASLELDRSSREREEAGQ